MLASLLSYFKLYPSVVGWCIPYLLFGGSGFISVKLKDIFSEFQTEIKHGTIFFFSLFVNMGTQSFNKDENIKFPLLSTLTNHRLRRIHVSGIGPSRKLSPDHSYCAYIPIQLPPAPLKCSLSSCSRREGLSLGQGHMA